MSRRRRIIRNAAECPECHDVIESKYRHDLATCSCGNIFVDGGHDYLRRGYQRTYPIDRCEYAGE